MITINVSTHKKNEMVNVTSQIRQALVKSGTQHGICVIFTPHTTAAITINENADPDVQSDMCKGLTSISPNQNFFRHFEGNSDAHIKSSIVGASENVIIENNNLVLGIWQGIYFCEFDGPRNRKVYIKFI